MKVELREGTASKLRVPHGERDILAFDTKLRGFFLRKFVSGQCSYGVKYQVAGKQVRMTLGAAVPGLLAEMRKRAAIVLSDARAGKDTAADRKIAQKPKPDVLALGGLIERYLADRKGKLRQTYYADITRQLQRYWAPLHSMAVGDIKRQNVVLVVDSIATERGAVAADRARSALSGFYTWALDRGLTDATPVENIAPRSQNGSRDRVLTEAEIADVWRACDRGNYSTIVRLLILTGQRRNEIADLSWDEINLAARQIELPGTRTKNHKGHIVPLSAEALALLPEHREGRGFLFGKGRGGFSGWSKAKGKLDASIAAMRGQPLAPWTLHDLRRSFVTHLNERGFASPHVIEALCNHISGSKGGIAGIYNRAAYSAEKREAIETWGRHISAIIGK